MEPRTFWIIVVAALSVACHWISSYSAALWTHTLSASDFLWLSDVDFWKRSAMFEGWLAEEFERDVDWGSWLCLQSGAVAVSLWWLSECVWVWDVHQASVGRPPGSLKRQQNTNTAGCSIQLQAHLIKPNIQTGVLLFLGYCLTPTPSRWWPQPGTGLIPSTDKPTTLAFTFSAAFKGMICTLTLILWVQRRPAHVTNAMFAFLPRVGFYSVSPF